MATETTNYHFSKPAETDYYDVNVQNNNWDVADQALKGLGDEKVDKNGGDIANTEVSEFAASSTEWPVPAAGEAPKTLWGKTKKFFEDFKNWMTGVCLLGQLVSNNTTNNANLPASAAAVYQEAQLRAQQFAQLNSDFERSNVQNVLFFSSFSEPFGIRIKDSTGQFEFQIVCNDSSVKFSRRVNGGEWSQCWSK